MRPGATIAGWLGRGSKRISRTGLYEFLDAEFGQIPAGARVLSIGAGGEINGRLLAVAERNGFHVTQLDIDADRKPDVVADITTYRPATPYDVVIAAEVFEHLKEPAAAVANIHAMLRPGGRLIASTPFLFPIHDAPHDFFRYTRHGLEHLLREFHDVKIDTRSTWAEAFGVLAVRIAREKRHRALEIVVVPAALAASPVLRAVGKLLPSDIMTSGYTMVATR
jgi:SAM-dependent methyltransferase